MKARKAFEDESRRQRSANEKVEKLVGSGLARFRLQKMSRFDLISPGSLKYA
jgi:hypothetical protein